MIKWRAILQNTSFQGKLKEDQQVMPQEQTILWIRQRQAKIAYQSLLQDILLENKLLYKILEVYFIFYQIPMRY